MRDKNGFAKNKLEIDLASINKEHPELSGSEIAALCSEAAL